MIAGERSVFRRVRVLASASGLLNRWSFGAVVRFHLSPRKTWRVPPTVRQPVSKTGMGSETAGVQFLSSPRTQLHTALISGGVSNLSTPRARGTFVRTEGPQGVGVFDSTHPQSTPSGAWRFNPAVNRMSLTGQVRNLRRGRVHTADSTPGQSRVTDWWT